MGGFILLYNTDCHGFQGRWLSAVTDIQIPQLNASAEGYSHLCVASSFWTSFHFSSYFILVWNHPSKLQLRIWVEVFINPALSRKWFSSPLLCSLNSICICFLSLDQSHYTIITNSLLYFPHWPLEARICFIQLCIL